MAWSSTTSWALWSRCWTSRHGGLGGLRPRGQPRWAPDRLWVGRVILFWLPGCSCYTDERARTKRSRRCRASAIDGSTPPRSWAERRLSSRTARTRSATGSAGTLPSSSADRVAVITANSCLLSLIVGGLTAVCVVGCGSRANSDLAFSQGSWKGLCTVGGQHGATGADAQKTVPPRPATPARVHPSRRQGR